MDIEKGVPLPDPMPRGGRPPKYPFGKMEVGDSILVDGSGASQDKCSAYSSAISYGRRNGKKFSGRLIAPGTVRIWRAG